MQAAANARRHQRRDPAQRLVRQIVSAWRTQAIHAAVETGVLDHLWHGPQPVAPVAQALGCSIDGLRRLLRALSALGICRDLGADRFALTTAGRLLCREHPGSVDAPNLRAMAQWWGGAMWPMWGQLLYSVQSGRSAREMLTGQRNYEHLDTQPQMAATFHAAMRAMTAMIVNDVRAMPLWRDVSTVVDIGGGHGELTLALLGAHPHLQGTVFDLPAVQAGAETRFAASAEGARCRFVAGSFFTALPAGADCYVLKSILHNWDDARCAEILRCCRQAMRADSTLLLIERVRPEKLRATWHDEALARTDLNMLAGLGGRERSLDEFSALLNPPGLTLKRAETTGFEFTVLVVQVAR